MSAERNDLRHYRMSVPAFGPIELASWLRQAAGWVESNGALLQAGTTTHLAAFNPVQCDVPVTKGTLYVEPPR
ncbi:MAG: hypothetical protein KAX77_04875 [Xanthomonadales bacterium]|nr:hypothetical protein [Xanthomonadales bacterium]